MAGTTQIVVQVRYEGSAALTMLSRIGSWERRIARRCGDACFVDGHDLGSGTANIFLLADDEKVDDVVNQIAELVKEQKLPEGVHVGVAEYLDEDRTDWRYRPALPPGLDRFDLTYPEDPRGL
jgi:hypothetical protein